MNLPTYMSGVLFTKAHKLVRIRVYEVLERYDLNPTYWSILGATAQAKEGISLLELKAEPLLALAEMIITRKS